MAEPPATGVERGTAAAPPRTAFGSPTLLFQRRVCNVPQRSDARPHEFQLVVIAVDDVFAIQLAGTWLVRARNRHQRPPLVIRGPSTTRRAAAGHLLRSTALSPGGTVLRRRAA